MSLIDKTWHLAQNSDEIKITEFELQLWRVFYGFLRWQERCEKSVNGLDLTGNELAVLHIIRMKDKPKSLYDIGRLLNRDDTFNIHYSIRKLLKMGLIEKVQSVPGDRKTFAYQATEAGIKNTDSYTEVRRSILIEMFSREPGLKLEELERNLAKIKAIYDDADRAVASYAKAAEPISPKKKSKK